jgi:protein-L-isoaspartate(D-aspartate) O-methyltransferase
MVDAQLRDRGVRNPRVLAAMLRVPRDRFVPGDEKDLAYADTPLPIGFGQTISQPLMVALMLEALELGGDERVLEVGTGSGYQAALLVELASEVYTLEIVPELGARAEATLTELGYASAHVVISDGSVGYAEAAPYDAIVVAAASPQLPKPLANQLAEGGRLVIPVGNRLEQRLL